jgi:septal ring factor EnvC (AmiA/AmiB activator)
MTDEQHKLEKRLESKELRIAYLEDELQQVKDDLRRMTRTYDDLYSSVKVFPKSSIPLIGHLEEIIRQQAFTIEEYQKHYAKWGTFYRDYQDNVKM